MRSCKNKIFLAVNSRKLIVVEKTEAEREIARIRAEKRNNGVLPCAICCVICRKMRQESCSNNSYKIVRCDGAITGLLRSVALNG